MKSKKTSVKIPWEALLPVVRKVCIKYGIGVDRLNQSQKEEIKEELGHEYGHLSTDEIHRQAVNGRRNGKLGALFNRKGPSKGGMLAKVQRSFCRLNKADQEAFLRWLAVEQK